MLEDESYLTQYGTFLISPADHQGYYINDIKKIPAHEFLNPKKILANLLDELAKRQEKRQEKMDEIMMAKRIIDAMSESLLNKHPK